MSPITLEQLENNDRFLAILTFIRQSSLDKFHQLPEEEVVKLGRQIDVLMRKAYRRHFPE